MRRVWWGLAVFAILLAFGCGETGEQESPVVEPVAASFAWPVVAPEPARPEPEPLPRPEEVEPVEPVMEKTGEPKAPRVLVRKGKGPGVVNLKLRSDSTLVVTGEHKGAGNFTVQLVPAKKTQVDSSFFGSVLRGSGKFKGQAAVVDLADGRYRAAVDAGDAWKLKFAQPAPSPKAKSIPRKLKGKGSKVKQLRVESELTAVVTARYKGSGDFIVRLIPMEDVAATDDASPVGVFDRVGRVNDDTRLENLRRGTYLVSVVARGAWSLNFTVAES